MGRGVSIMDNSQCRHWREQIEIYRTMTREQRVATALRRHELACEMARLGIRRPLVLSDRIQLWHGTIPGTGRIILGSNARRSEAKDGQSQDHLGRIDPDEPEQMDAFLNSFKVIKEI